MAYTIPCARCGKSWNGFGGICDQCRTTEAIEAQTRAIRDQIAATRQTVDHYSYRSSRPYVWPTGEELEQERKKLRVETFIAVGSLVAILGVCLYFWIDFFIGRY